MPSRGRTKRHLEVEPDASTPSAGSPTGPPTALALALPGLARDPEADPVVRRDTTWAKATPSPTALAPDGPQLGANRPSAWSSASPSPTARQGGTPQLGGARGQFAAALSDAAPADKAEAATRMKGLRALLAAMSTAERSSIVADTALLAKARTFVGAFEYMTLVAALGMAAKAPSPGPGKGAAAGPQHMSGAEADAFIQEHLGAIGHLKPFLDTAMGAGKKADGFIATVDQANWELIYPTQYPGEVMGTDDLGTNAFIANKHADRPAIIHAERGTRSTAIHESMHRYSELTVLRTYGSPMNEGITEYFTRLITDRDGKPVNGKASNRANYQSNWRFVTRLLSVLGTTPVEQQTNLAEIYFSGRIGVLRTEFEARCAEGGLSSSRTARRWKRLAAALSAGNWQDAVAEFPPARKKKAPKADEAQDSEKATPSAAPDTGGDT